VTLSRDPRLINTGQVTLYGIRNYHTRHPAGGPPRTRRSVPPLLPVAGAPPTPRGGALSPSRGGLEGPPGAREPRNPRIRGFTRKTRKNPFFRPSRGDPAKPLFSTYRAPPRGVDVKPPSARGPETTKRARFGQKGQKWPKSSKKPILGYFHVFGGVLSPSGAPGGPSRGLLLHQPLAAGPCGPSGGPA